LTGFAPSTGHAGATLGQLSQAFGPVAPDDSPPSGTDFFATRR